MHAYNVFHKSWAPHAVMMILAMKQRREEKSMNISLHVLYTKHEQHTTLRIHALFQM